MSVWHLTLCMLGNEIFSELVIIPQMYESKGYCMTAIIGLQNQFLVFLRVTVLDRFYYMNTLGFPRALEIMENLENYKKKVPCMEKSWNLKKPE